MNTQLFIPKKCKVGFNLRDDTYTGKLGYVVGFDGKKWRKEHSWESWRQKVGQACNGGGNYVKGKWVANPDKIYGDEVTPIEFDNVPTAGFVLNKKAGGGRSHWNTRRTVARIYDPRGFEFEIGIENLLYILEHCNCMRGKGLEGEFIYSWDGKDLLLLPSECPEFQQSMNFTNLQSLKVSAKDLVPGCSYKTKKEENFIYVGRYMWYETDWYKGKGRKGKKCHIFYSEQSRPYYNDKDGYFFIKNDASFLAVKNSDEVVSNFAEIIDKFKKNPKSSDIVKCEFVPSFSDEIVEVKHHGPGLKKHVYFGKEGDEIVQFNVQSISNGYYPKRVKSFNEKTKSVGLTDRYYYDSGAVSTYGVYSYRGSERGKLYTLEDLKKFDFCDLYITLESGKRIKVNDLGEI